MKKIVAKYLFLISTTVIMIACDQKFQKKYDSEGNLQVEYNLKNGEYEGEYIEYFPSGNIKERHFFKNGKPVDTSFYYDDNQQETIFIKLINLPRYNKKISYHLNGKIKDSGYVDKLGRKYGKWFFYDEEGKLKFKDEYFVVNDKEYLNQTIAYDENENILFSKSKIININVFLDTIPMDKPINVLSCIEIGHFMGNKAKAKVLLSKGYGNKINKDFSNLDSLELDTIYNLGMDKINGPTFPELNQDKCVAFGKWFNKTGENILRGVIIEYIKDSIQDKENRFYFEKTIFVNDSLSQLREVSSL